MRKQLYRLMEKYCAAELVTAAYAGILERAPDDAGLEDYGSQLRDATGKDASLAKLLAALSRSQEHWRKSLERRAEQLVQVACKAILRRPATEQEVKSLSAQLRKEGELSGLLAAFAGSDEHWERGFAPKSKQLVLDLYRKIFKRDPDSRALSAYTRQLSGSKDVPALLSAIGASAEFWDAQIAERAEQLVRVCYQVLLKREPEDSALKAYAAQLKEHKSFADLLRPLVQSQERLRVVLQERAEEVVGAAFSALLRREPEPAALRAYATRLREGQPLAEMLAAIAGSREHWLQLLLGQAEEVVGALFRGLLGREPDSVGLGAYAERLRDSKDLAGVVAAIGSSQERERKIKVEQDWPHPALTYDRRTWVFIHVQKTAGTSMQNMLVDCFGDDQVYHEHSDMLHLHSPAELSTYGVFSGHFNYDSLAFIPRRKLSVFTFLREPKQRLLSLYNFWRAHDPAAPGFHERMKLANEMDIESFYQCDEIARRRDTWNHMTWCVMGSRQWKQWRLHLTNSGAEERAWLLERLRPVIRERLREFCFVGLQEDFATSCRVLFDILGRPCPAVRSDHSVEKLSSVHAHIKRVAKPALTTKIDQVLSELIELDTILYEEAKTVYSELLARRSGSTERESSERESSEPAPARARIRRAKSRR